MLRTPEAVIDDITSADTRMRALYDAHAKAVHRFHPPLTFGDRQTAGDLTQETMLRAWGKIDALDANTTRSFRPGKPQLTPTDCHRRWLRGWPNSTPPMTLTRAFRVTAHAVGISYGTQRSVINEVYDDSLVPTVQAFDGALQATIVDGEPAVQILDIMARDLCRSAGGSGSDRNDPPAAAADRAREVTLAALEHKFRAWVADLGPDNHSGTRVPNGTGPYARWSLPSPMT